MRWLFVAVITGLMTCAHLTGASAEPVKLSGDEIKSWINGRTVEGVWAGTRYSQDFQTNGATIYTPDGGRPDRGRWWVTETQYCSHWERSGGSCYNVLRDGETLIWEAPGSGKRYPATVD